MAEEVGVEVQARLPRPPPSCYDTAPTQSTATPSGYAESSESSAYHDDDGYATACGYAESSAYYDDDGYATPGGYAESTACHDDDDSTACGYATATAVKDTTSDGG